MTSVAKKGTTSLQEDTSDKTSIVASETFRGRIAEAHAAPPCLILLVGPAPLIGKRWPLTEASIIIGRNPETSVSVEERSVSRRHAQLFVDGGDVVIEDLNSANFTEINGVVLEAGKRVQLRNNDQIKTGNVIFKFLEKGSIESVAVQQTYDRSQTDALTGVHNKGALNIEGPDLFKKAQLSHLPFSVVMFDIDHFKKVNDTYGHLAGDYVLKEIAELVRNRLIRHEDFIARYGGEEFVIILQHQNGVKAQEVAERIRQTVEKHEFNFQGTRIPITVSLGTSSIAGNVSSWEELLNEADQALYRSKKNGRNRVTVF